PARFPSRPRPVGPGEREHPTASPSGTGAGDVLWLSADALRTVLHHCRRERPREACGWLAGRWQPPGGPEGGRRGVTALGLRAYPMANVAEDPIRRYLMDPEEQFAVLRTMRRRGEELVGIYHSHPATAPVPSATDIDLAYTKDAVYLIVSLAGPRPELRAWWLDCDTRRVEEVVVQMERDDGAGGGEDGGGERGGADHYGEREAPHLSR